MQITFSGRLGSGKSTVCAILKEKYGYEIYSTGTVQRKVAEEMGIDTLELNKRMKEDPKLDHTIDDAVVKLSREKAGQKIVYDSRMAWHFAENTFKVYMYVDPTVAGERVLAADRGSVETYDSAADAAKKLMERTNEENKRFKAIYGVDNLDFSNYDLIIDSTYATPEHIADIIIESASEYEAGGYGATRVYLSPKNVFPTSAPDSNDGEPEICVKDGFYYAVSGHKKLSSAQADDDCAMMRFRLTDKKEEITYDKKLIEEYEKNGSFTYKTKPE